MTTAPTYHLGIDGGGTGCRARVTDATGRTLGAGAAGPATLRLGAAAAWDAVLTAGMAALHDAGLAEGSAAGPLAWLAEAGRSVRVGVGLAGVGRPGALAAITAMAHPFASRRIASDQVTACLGAHGGADGGIVIAGTGSAGYARHEGREVRVGGYGFPVSDEGSGAWLGLEALRSALRAHDGRIPATPLHQEVMARFQHDPFRLTAWAEQASATEYATLAPWILRHAGTGDPAAQGLARHAAAALEELIAALVSHGVRRIALLGGLAPGLTAWLSTDARRHLSTPLGDGVDGALRLAVLSDTA